MKLLEIYQNIVVLYFMLESLLLKIFSLNSVVYNKMIIVIIIIIVMLFIIF
jgi:hypothetical protein